MLQSHSRRRGGGQSDMQSKIRTDNLNKKASKLSIT